MQTKVVKFKQRFHGLLKWKNIRNLIIINTGLLLFTFVFNNKNSQNWPYILAISSIVSFAIGTSIYLLIHLSGVLEVKASWKKYLGLEAIFILGGWIGMLIASGIYCLLFNVNLATHVFSKFFTNTFLFIFFGSSIMSYFLLKDRLEHTIAKLAEKEVNEQHLLRLKTKAELEALHAKVNPHFLFNTLNSIASLIPVDPAKAEEMVQKLSHLFRYTLNANNHESMKLADELQVIQEYLEIEKVRLGNRLSYNIEIDEKLMDVCIPGLLLQPLVENSVKHGIASTKGGGHIGIKCSENNGSCRIEIVDTGKGFNESETVEGFGLSSVRERLTLYYGNDYEFQISTDQGVAIFMRIPLFKPSAISM